MGRILDRIYRIGRIAAGLAGRHRARCCISCKVLRPLSKSLRYRIGDEFFRFWFRFVAKYSAAVELGSYDVLRELVRRDWAVFSGVSLEQWFRSAFANTGRFTSLGGWWDLALEDMNSQGG